MIGCYSVLFKGLRRCRRPRHEGAGAAADLEETATSNPSLQSAGVALRCKQHGWQVGGLGARQPKRAGRTRPDSFVVKKKEFG